MREWLGWSAGDAAIIFVLVLILWMLFNIRDLLRQLVAKR